MNTFRATLHDLSLGLQMLASGDSPLFQKGTKIVSDVYSPSHIQGLRADLASCRNSGALVSAHTSQQVAACGIALLEAEKVLRVVNHGIARMAAASSPSARQSEVTAIQGTLRAAYPKYSEAVSACLPGQTAGSGGF